MTHEETVEFLRKHFRVDSETKNRLTAREELILRMRFGVGEGSEHTLEEVGRSFNVTRERIRQIESKALRKLRNVGPAKPGTA